MVKRIFKISFLFPAVKVFLSAILLSAAIPLQAAISLTDLPLQAAIPPAAVSPAVIPPAGILPATIPPSAIPLQAASSLTDLPLQAAIPPAPSLPSGNRWDRGILDTAAGADYLSSREKAVVYEINKLRSNPRAYAEEYLVPLLSKYQGKKLVLPGEIPILTKEGIPPLRDAIRELRQAPPVPLLIPDYRLTRSARDHQKDQSATGRTGHVGSDGSAIKERIMRYGKPMVGMAENIFYGDPDAFLAVLFLIIDDGVPGRGHRKVFLDKKYRLVGVAEGSHPRWGNLFVIDFAHAFTSE